MKELKEFFSFVSDAKQEVDTSDWRDGYAPTEFESEDIIKAEPIKNEPLPDYVRGAMDILDRMGNL